MRTTQQFSITLPKEMAETVKAKVMSGEYATESEVIRDGLRALMARDRALETWLQTEVAVAYDEAQSDPSSQITGSDVRARLEALHERTVKERS